MATVAAKAWNVNGDLVKDIVITDADEALEFYAHQLLHADDVVCVEISDGHGAIKRCDPGLTFDEVVNRGPLG